MGLTVLIHAFRTSPGANVRQEKMPSGPGAERVTQEPAAVEAHVILDLESEIIGGACGKAKEGILEKLMMIWSWSELRSGVWPAKFAVTEPREGSLRMRVGPNEVERTLGTEPLFGAAGLRIIGNGVLPNRPAA